MRRESEVLTLNSWGDSYLYNLIYSQSPKAMRPHLLHEMTWKGYESTYCSFVCRMCRMKKHTCTGKRWWNILLWKSIKKGTNEFFSLNHQLDSHEEYKQWQIYYISLLNPSIHKIVWFDMGGSLTKWKKNIFTKIWIRVF